MNAELKSELERLVADLVEGRYLELEHDGRAGGFPAEELRNAVAAYGGQLVAIPSEGWSLIDEIPIDAASNEIALDVPLWTVDEGRSDLMLSLTATRHQGRWKLQIDNLRVP